MGVISLYPVLELYNICSVISLDFILKFTFVDKPNIPDTYPLIECKKFFLRVDYLYKHLRGYWYSL